eukprot:g5530.t1
MARPLKHLFSPLTLKSGHVLPNRAVMGSMHTGMEDFGVVNGNPFTGRGGLSDLAAFYAERAPGAGLIVTGGVAPNRAGKVSPLAGKMSNILEARAHREVTEAVHDNDGLIVMQILHSGRYGYHPWNVSASPIKAPIGWFKPKVLKKGSIFGSVESTIDDFVRCAELAKKAGYDGVEVMGSEGYLINQFIVEHTNKRTDEWGGAYENRMKFPVKIVEKIRRAVGEDFIIMYRLSMLDLIRDGSTWEEIVTLAKAIESAGATIINTGIGWHEARVPTIATKVPRAAFAWVTEKMMGEVSIPLCATNRINSAEVADDTLSSGKADLISMARPFLADPYLLQKAKEGRQDEVNTCIGCNQACLDFTFRAMRASCLTNPTAGYENEMKEKAADVSQQQRIAVVGAGPAGLAFATTASRRGHSVTLYDAASEIGGQFNMAKKVPGKEEFHETIRYFRKRLELDGVDVHLNTKANIDLLLDKENNFDAVVLATGVTPRKLDIPGADHPNVLSYVDVLHGHANVGENVVIVGAGGIGFDVAEYLTHDNDEIHDGGGSSQNIDLFMDRWGVDMENETRGGLLNVDTKSKWKSPRKVQLLQRKTTKHGKGLGKTTGWIHRAGLNKVGVEMIGGCTYKKIDENGNLHVEVKTKVNKSKQQKPEYKTESRVLENDNIVVCAGQISLRDLEEPLLAAGKKCFRIGGSQHAGDLDANRAIDQGTRLALCVEKAKSGDVYERPLEGMAKWVEKIRSFNPTGAPQ